MSKKFSFALVLVIILSLTLCLTGCGKTDTNSIDSVSTDADNNTTDNSSIDDISSDSTTTNSDTNSTESVVKNSTESVVKNDITSTSNSSSTPKPENKPKVLYPKTDLKLDTYFYSEFLNSKKDTYTKNMIAFHDGGAYGYSYDYSETPYFSKERCTEIYQGWGDTFNEANFKEKHIITVNGIKYYYIEGYGGGTAESCDLTDKAIIITVGDDKNIELSLRTDGSLVIDVAQSDKFGTVGTTYKIK